MPTRPGAAFLAANDLVSAVEAFQCAVPSRAAQDVVVQGLRQRHLDLERAQQGEPYFRDLREVWVETAYWTIVQDGFVYNHDVHAKNLASSPYVQGRVTADGQGVVATLPRPRLDIRQACVLMGGDDNYSHWLYRNVIKLSTLDRAGILFERPWLMNADLRRHQREYLELLGQTPDRLILVERPSVVACSDVRVPALLIGKRAIAGGIEWLHERFRPWMAPRGHRRRRLLISRRDEPRRALANESALAAALAPFGFETIVPGELPVREQIAAFSSAEFIVAAHGAGLTNMLFAPSTARIVEIASTAILHMDLFRMLAKATGQRVETVVSDDYRVPARQIGVNTPYWVAVPEVIQMVERMLAEG